MKITREAPPDVPWSSRAKYQDVHLALASLEIGEWLKIEDIDKDEINSIRVSMSQIRTRRTFKIKTVIIDGKLYIQKKQKQAAIKPPAEREASEVLA